MTLRQKLLNVLAFSFSPYVLARLDADPDFTVLVTASLNSLVDAGEIAQGTVIRADAEFVEVRVSKHYPLVYEVFRFETGSIVDLASVSAVMDS